MKNGFVKCTNSVNWGRVVRYMGVVVSVVGFVVLIGVIGASEFNEVPWNEWVPLAILGILMFAIGAWVARVFDWQQNNKSYEVYSDHIPDKVGDMIGKIAWNGRYSSYMTIVDYKNDTDWVFVLCSPNGRPESTPIRTHRSIEDYNWNIMKYRVDTGELINKGDLICDFEELYLNSLYSDEGLDDGQKEVFKQIQRLIMRSATFDVDHLIKDISDVSNNLPNSDIKYVTMSNIESMLKLYLS